MIQVKKTVHKREHRWYKDSDGYESNQSDDDSFLKDTDDEKDKKLVVAKDFSGENTWEPELILEK